MADPVLFELGFKDVSATTFDRIDMRLNAIEAHRAFDVLENKIDAAGAAAGEAANSKSHGLAAFAVVAGIALTAVNALTDGLRQAAEWLKRTVAESINLASELETSQIVFTNIFKGNTEAADAFLGNLEGLAKDLRVEFSQLSGLARTLLPDTQSINEFERLAEAAVLLTKADPSQTLEGARFALEEAVSGSFRSLVGRFEVPREFAAMARKLQDEGVAPLEATLTSLEAFFEKSGLNIESFSDTYDTALSNLRSTSDLAKTAFGQPILEEVRQILAPINEFLSENIDTVKLLATSFGDLATTIADVVDIDLEGAIADFDFRPIFELVDGINDFIVTTSVAIDTVKALKESTEGLSVKITLIEDIKEWVEGRGGLQQATITFMQLATAATATFAAIQAGIKSSIEGFGFLGKALMSLIGGDFEAAIENSQKGLETFANQTDAAGEAFKNSFLDGAQRIDELSEAWDENNKRLEERVDRLAENTDALDEEIAAILRAKQAEKELQKQLDQAKEAQASLNEMREKLAVRAIEAQIAATRQLADDQLDASRRAEDIEIAGRQRQEDIARSYAEAKNKLLENAAKEEIQIEQDADEERRRLADDRHEARLDLEESYQRRLQDIKDSFARRAREAAIANDAIEFLRAKRAMKDELEDAKTGKDRQRSDLDKNYAQQEKDLNDSLARQRESFDNSLREQLENLDANLQKQNDDYARSLARQEEAYQLSLSRQAEDRAIAQQREEEDFNRSLGRQLAQMEETYGKDFVDVTVESLKAQAGAYEEVFGENGFVEQTMSSFFAKQYDNLEELEDKLRAAQKVAEEEAEKEAERQRFIDARTEQNRGAGYRIGQAGLVSDFLTRPTSVNSPAAPMGSSSVSTTNRNASLSLDFRGLDPYVQMVAQRTAMEVFRNAMAGSKA